MVLKILFKLAGINLFSEFYGYQRGQVRKGGLIALDNVLWYGKVADEQVRALPAAVCTHVTGMNHSSCSFCYGIKARYCSIFLFYDDWQPFYLLV